MSSESNEPQSASPKAVPERILLIRLSAIGDCLHAVPTLVALRRAFPKAYIGWAIEKGPHTLLEGHPLVDRFHIFPRHAFKKKEGTWIGRLKTMSEFRDELKSMKYDVAIDLQGLTKSGLVARWSRARQRIGFKGEDSRELNLLFMNARQTTPEWAVHIVEKNMSLLGILGIDAHQKPEWVMPEYKAEHEAVSEFLIKAGLKNNGTVEKYAVLNPGATWITKRWPADRFGDVARMLTRSRDLPIVVTWAGEEERIAAELIVKMAEHQRVVMAPDTNLRQLAALIASSKLFIGNDTGPMHLAVALNIPTVAVFGGTDPLRNGPYGRNNRILAAGPECQPCWKTTCKRGDLKCLDLVQPGKVVSSAENLLDRAGRDAR